MRIDELSDSCNEKHETCSLILFLQDVLFSVGVGGSKFGSRDRAIEQAMKVLDIAEVKVETRPRQWKDKAYPQMVLVNKNMPRNLLPPLFHPPEGTKEHALALIDEQGKRDGKQLDFTEEEQAILKNVNLSHIGPSSTGEIEDSL